MTYPHDLKEIHYCSSLKSWSLSKLNCNSMNCSKNNSSGCCLEQRKAKKYKAIVIIDNHEQETYSKEKRSSTSIRGGKHKNGTNFFFKYMTMQVLVKDKLITLSVRFYSRETNQARLVDKLIKYAKDYVKIKDNNLGENCLKRKFSYLM